MSSREKNTKERILEEALRLFAQSGYMGTSMNDISTIKVSRKFLTVLLKK